jgi:immune inhibitor A
VRRLAPGLLAGTAALALSATMLQPAQANLAARTADEGTTSHTRTDNRHGMHHKKMVRQKEKALELLDAGKAELVSQPGGGATVKLADGEYVEFPIDKKDKIFTILAEFGDQGSGRYGTTPGPLHNQIPRPDRDLDNSTYWIENFSRASYVEMFNGDGESFKDYYQKLSSGRYTAVNTVRGWVKVDGNASSYGDNAIEDFGGSWNFIRDAGDAWWDAQIAAGKTPAEINTFLAKFDVWDRYDFDNDGDFNEADGYIDHFQAVHAGEGEEAGATADAIWSHRWFAYGDDYGITGPTVGGEDNLYGGTQIGSSKYFIGDYTVEPENGGLGVFAHEFGHDLGLPDYYDTSGGENGTAFWTLMSSGSWLNHGGDAIGTTPGVMGPEEKLFLGWLDYKEVDAGENGTFNLGPSQHTYEGADQAIKVNLPDVETVQDYTVPPSGGHAWYSDRGDDLSNTLTRTVPASGRVVVKASTWYDTEEAYDFFYVEYSTDGGDTWTQLAKIDGDSGNRWVSKRWAYQAGGAESVFRFRYATDGGVNEPGVFLDDISITSGDYSFTDGAEAGDNGWEVDGWKISTGTETKTSKAYYLIENRQYVGYDSTLEVGPYQFSEAFTRPNWVERFPFQNGMLVWYVDHSFPDNNNDQENGRGYALPVDVRPNSLTYPDGSSPSNRREPFDATFGLEATDEVCLHKQVADKKAPEGYVTLAACAPSVAGVPTFDDSDPEAYWNPANPQNSTKVAGLGITATVTGSTGGFLTVQVDYPAAP